MLKDFMGKTLVRCASRIEGMVKHRSREVISDEVDLGTCRDILPITVSWEAFVMALIHG